MFQVLGLPDIHVGDPGGVPGSWLLLGPTLGIAAIWANAPLMENLSNFDFQINQSFKIS